MTESDVFFDTWAWWELLRETSVGQRLYRRRLGNGQAKVHSSALCLGELAAKLDELGREEETSEVLMLVKSHARLHDVDDGHAEHGGRLRRELRRAHRDTGLVDGIILAQARRLGIKLVSGDPAFGKSLDVVGE